MSKPKTATEYETVQIGAALLARALFKELGVASAIDQAITSQPEIEATYGHLLQAVILNRLTFDPQPLYRMSAWAAQHGIDDLLGIDAAWLDDDRLGAGLDAIATHQIEIWAAILKRAHQRFKLPLEELHGDTTSIYFEGDFDQTNVKPGQIERVPHLCIGYNKDGQPDKKQMVLSLLCAGRVPIWFSPWDGNRSDNGVCLHDLKELRQRLLLPENALMIGDSKVCQRETMLELCRHNWRFLAPHPWMPPAKAAWRETWEKIDSGLLAWQPLDYRSQNEARKAAEKQAKYRACEIEHRLDDQSLKTEYQLRWIFVHSSRGAELAVKQREKALVAGLAALSRLSGLIGKYHYRKRETITRRIDQDLRKAKASAYFKYTLTGTEGERDWRLQWERDEATIAEETKFDGISLMCTNTPASDLSANEVVSKYKEQIQVEQTIDFIKSPVELRPTWLHNPKRIAGLTLLIMIAVLLAMLLEYEVRRLLREKKKKIDGLRPEGRKDPAPTAKSLLRSFSDYSLVIIKYSDGSQEVRYPKFKHVPQQIWDLLGLPPLSG
jgi:transposase